MTSRRIFTHGGDDHQNIRRLASPVVLAAGASGLLIRRCHGLNVPERRCPRNAIAERPDNIGLANLDAAVQVRAIEARPLTAVVILHHISGSARVDTILVRAAIAAPRLDRPLVTHGNNFRVLVALRQRGRAGVKPKNADKDNDEEEHEALPQF